MGVHRGRGAIAALFLLAVLAPLVAGGGDGPDPAQPVWLTVGTKDEMKARNVYTPIVWDDAHTMAVLARVYDTPVQRDLATGGIFPRLAVGVDRDGDDRLDPAEIGDFTVPWAAIDVTVFYDLGNASFHDGVPVTSMDLLFSYHAWALHPIASGPIRVLMDRGGAPGTNFTTDRWLGVREVDDGDGVATTAALRFTRSYAFVNFAWATLGIPVLPRHRWEGTGGGRHADFGLAVYPEGHPRAGQGVPPSEVSYRPFNPSAAEVWSMADADIVGSGHFRFEAWVQGVEVRLAANPSYAFGPPTIDGIRFRVYRTTQLFIFALQTGEIDLILGNVPSEFFPDLDRFPDIARLEVRDLFPAVLLFNVRRMPWGYDAYPPADRSADVGHLLRRVAAHLADRQTIVDALLQGHGAVATSMVAPWNVPWHNASVPAYPYDRTVAAALLDSAEAQMVGIGPDPPGPCTKDTPLGCRTLPARGNAAFEILTPQADYDPIIASTGALLADAMRQVGLNAVSRPTAFGNLVVRLRVLDFDLALAMRPEIHASDPWTLGLGDPDYLWDGFHASNAAAGRNAVGFWDAEFDAAADASRLAGDFMPRDWHVHRAQGVLAERLPAVPLYYWNWTWAWRTDRFTGYVLAATTVFNYWTLQGLEPAPNPPPEIALRAPADGSVIPPGTVIDLDVWDDDLRAAWWSRDGGLRTALPAPYDVDTSGWPEGLRTLNVSAEDAVGNLAWRSYRFTVDGTPPAIALLSPADGALVPGGTVLDFDVRDAHLTGARIAVDGGAPQPLPAPFDRSLDGLPDGPHTFLVDAVDAAGNVAARAYSVTLDTVAPSIALLSPADGSKLPRDGVASLAVTDAHLAAVAVSVDGGAAVPLVAPFALRLRLLGEALGFGEGVHAFTVRAMDGAGNAADRTYTFDWDPTPPNVVRTEPTGDAVGTEAEISVTFSEAMNRTSVEEAFSLTDGTRTWTAADGSLVWSDDGRSFTFAPGGGLAPDRDHEFRLAGTLTDEAGNPMGDDAVRSFRTAPIGLPVSPGLWIWAAVLVAVFLALAFGLWRRRKRGGRLDEQERGDVADSAGAAGTREGDTV